MPTTVFSDTFTGSTVPLIGHTPDLGTSWQNLSMAGNGSWSLTGGGLVNWVPGTGTNGLHITVANHAAPLGDFQSATVTGGWGGASTRQAGPAVRATASQHYVAAWLTSASGNSTLTLIRNGTQVGSAATGQPTVGVTIAIKAIGAVITVSMNGVPVITYTDPSPLTGGKTGLWHNGGTTTLTWDTFVAADETPPVSKAAFALHLDE